MNAFFPLKSNLVTEYAANEPIRIQINIVITEICKLLKNSFTIDLSPDKT